MNLSYMIGISGWWVYQDGFVWLNSPHGKIVNFAVPIVQFLGQANDIRTTVFNNHHHLILYLTQDKSSNFTNCIHIKNKCFLITDPKFHSK